MFKSIYLKIYATATAWIVESDPLDGVTTFVLPRTGDDFTAVRES